MPPFHVILQATAGWPCTFEAAVEALEQLPRMFVELDGSFVWRTPDEPAWQLDGCLFDRAGQLYYVELKGDCPAVRLREFLACLSASQADLTVQVMREARVVPLDAFLLALETA